MKPPRWWRPDAGELALIYLAAVAARLPAWRAPLFGDEAWHFYGARHFGRAAANVHTMMRDDVSPLFHLVWWRPLFEMGLAPAAWISFDVWRLAHLLVTATLPLLAWLILRDQGVRRVYAYGVAAVVAFDGLFVSWSVIVFPDGLLTTAFALGTWSTLRGRPRVAGGSFLAAMWIKESALVGVVGVLGLSYLSRLRDGAKLCPVRLDPMERATAWAAGIGLLPLLFYLSQGGAPPGWTHGGDWTLALDRLTFLLALAPLLALGLAWPRTRRSAILSFAYPAFYLYIGAVLGRHIEAWYFVLPAFLALVGSGLTLDELYRRARTDTARSAGRTVAAVFAALMIVQVGAPATTPWKGPLSHPVGRTPDGSYVDAVRFLNSRDRTVAETFEALRGRDHTTLFLVDMSWFFSLYPAAEWSDTVRVGRTPWYDGTLGGASEWANLVETFAASTVIQKSGSPIVRGLLQTYADCTVFENADYAILDARPCSGRAAELHEKATTGV